MTRLDLARLALDDSLRAGLERRMKDQQLRLSVDIKLATHRMRVQMGDYAGAQAALNSITQEEHDWLSSHGTVEP